MVSGRREVIWASGALRCLLEGRDDAGLVRVTQKEAHLGPRDVQVGLSALDTETTYQSLVLLEQIQNAAAWSLLPNVDAEPEFFD